MKLSQYIEELHITPYKWILEHNTDVEIFSFKPLPINTKHFDAHIIYIDYLSNFSFEYIDTQANFLFINDSKESLDKKEMQKNFPNANFIIINRSLPLRDLYDIACDLFLAETRFTTFINRMTAASNANRGLQYLVDEAYAIMKSPIVVIDSSYKILAMYHDTTSDNFADLQRQRELGYLTGQNLERMRRDKVYEQLRKSNYPVYKKAEDSPYGWLDVLVYVHGIEIAEIGMMEYDHPFTHYDLEFLNFFRQLVAWEMQKNDFYKDNRGMMHSIFMSELLEHKIPNRKIANHRKELLNWRETAYMYVLTIFPDDNTDFKQRAGVFAIHLQHLLPDSRWVVYESNLVMLIIKEDSNLEDFLPGSLLYERLKYNNLCGVLSNHFSNLLELRKYYEQTLDIIKLRTYFKKDSAILIYSDYYFYHIAQIISEKYDLEDFFHPAIIAIQKHDEENQTDYLNTLTEYLIHVDDPTTCAKNLFIHKNTFFYRMNKIRHLFGLDLNNGMERLKLHLAIEFKKLV